MRRLSIFAVAVIFCLGTFTLQAENQKEPEKKPVASGVCPPFYLKDEASPVFNSDYLVQKPPRKEREMGVSARALLSDRIQSVFPLWKLHGYREISSLSGESI